MPKKIGSKSKASSMKKKVAGGVLVGGARKKRATSKTRKAVGGKIVGAAMKKRSSSKTVKRGGSKSAAKKTVKKSGSKTVKKVGGASKSGRKLSAYNIFVKKFLADFKKSKDYANYSPRERMAMAAAAYRKA